MIVLILDPHADAITNQLWWSRITRLEGKMRITSGWWNTATCSFSEPSYEKPEATLRHFSLANPIQETSIDRRKTYRSIQVNYNMKLEILHCSIRANIRPVQSAIWRSLLLLGYAHSARCRHRFRPGGVYRNNAINLLQKENSQRTKLAVSWTCIDMICYDMLWYDMICDMISSVRSMDLWNFGGLSFWAASQCGKNSPDNLDFHAESLWQQSSWPGPRATSSGLPKWPCCFFNFGLAVICTDLFDM